MVQFTCEIVWTHHILAEIGFEALVTSKTLLQ